MVIASSTLPKRCLLYAGNTRQEGEDSVDAVADAALEIVAVHAVLGLDVADDGLDGRATLHLATAGSRDATAINPILHLA